VGFQGTTGQEISKLNPRVVRRLFKGGLNMNRRSGILRDFPEFMKRPENMVPVRQQNTPDVQGYYYTASDGSQMAF
jgi:hypothetical protein